jgi:hypothetical protein
MQANLIPSQLSYLHLLYHMYRSFNLKWAYSYHKECITNDCFRQEETFGDDR